MRPSLWDGEIAKDKLMRRTILIPPEKVVPSIEAVLKGQGIPESVNPDERTRGIAKKAISVYSALSHPLGIIMEVSKEEFAGVYHGEGENQGETPLDKIYRACDSLALFAVTVGESVSTEISRLFEEGEFAVGSMLDSVASEGTEMAAVAVETDYKNYLEEMGCIGSSSGTMRFSPGYCGWDMSSQKKLFELLGPVEIGITLRESFLMQPLKSISGVIVAGPKGIFQFDDDFPFCSDCDTHSCRDRIEAILNQ